MNKPTPIAPLNMTSPRQIGGAAGASASNPSSIGAGSSPPVDEPSNLTAAAGTPNRCTFFGPPTTHSLEGAGGPFNEWDAKIAAAHRRGKPQLARQLQEARARVNIAFDHLEPVWVPTDHQRVMLGLRACLTGLRVMDAKVAA